MIDPNHLFETIVIGAGPAGITCGLEAQDSGLDFLVLERESRVGGQLPSLPGPVRNFPGAPIGAGDKLQEQMELNCREFINGKILTGCTVSGVSLSELTVQTNQGHFRAKTLILATGYRIRTLPLEIPEHLAPDVTYLTPPIETFAGNEVAIVGGRDSAIFIALDLAKICPTVHVIARAAELSARPDLLDRLAKEHNVQVHLQSNVTAISGESHLEQVVLQTPSGATKIRARQLLVKIGYAPNTELFRGQVEMDALGHVKVDHEMRTSAPYVCAAGDIITPGYARLATALGTASIACRTIRHMLGHSVGR